MGNDREVTQITVNHLDKTLNGWENLVYWDNSWRYPYHMWETWSFLYYLNHHKSDVN